MDKHNQNMSLNYIYSLSWDSSVSQTGEWHCTTIMLSVYTNSISNITKRVKHELSIKATIQQHASLCIHNITAETHHFLCNQGFTHSCLFWQPYINCFDSSSAQLNFSTIQLFFSHLLMSLCCSSHNKHTRIFIILILEHTGSSRNPKHDTFELSAQVFCFNLCSLHFIVSVK